MARVFSAVDIEAEDVLKELEQIQETIDLGFSKIPRRKMHVTLEFFEDIDQSEIEKVEQALKNVETEPFEAEIKSVGAFPSEDYIRVVWAGIKSHQIFQLQKQASVHSVSNNNRNEFKPHITFLRVDDVSKQKKQKLQKNIKQFKQHSFGKIKINKVKLFESKLTPHGSKYKLLSEIEL